MKCLTSKNQVTSELITSLVCLERADFPYPWKDAGLQNFLETTDAFFLICDDLDSPNSFLLALISTEEALAHLLKIVVRRDCQRQGKAALLMERFAAEAKNRNLQTLYLEVAVDNIKAISLYEKFKWKTIHRSKKFYADGKDAFIMTLRII